MAAKTSNGKKGGKSAAKKPNKARTKNKKSHEPGKSESNKSSLKMKNKSDVIDLTSSKDESSCITASPIKPEPEDCKFVLDKSTDAKINVPIYRAPIKAKPRSIKDIMDNLRCHGNLLAPSSIDCSLNRQAVDLAERKKRREEKMKLKRLRSGIRSCKKEIADDEIKAKDIWSEKGNAKKKRIDISAPLPDDPIFNLPLSYNPNPASESLRGLVKKAAHVLTKADHKKEKIEKVASAIRNAKPLSMAEQLAEMSAGLFNEEEPALKNQDEHDEHDKSDLPKPVERKERLTKKERDRRAEMEKAQKLRKRRKDQNRLMNDLNRLRTIKNQVAAEAARRSALQTYEAQRRSARLRKLKIFHKRVSRKATIQAVQQREAAELVKRAPAAVVGVEGGMELGKSLRLIQPRLKTLALERLANLQRRGMLLDHRAMELGRRAVNQRKRHGYKTFEINR